jgi:regulator of nucleoside diphosphate kinase
MNHVTASLRWITELDHRRLSMLSDHQPALSDLLDSAEVVPSRQVDRDVVTLNSQIVLFEPRTGRRQSITLTYPRDADPAQGRVSVLSPVGMAVLGQRAGATVAWDTPTGERHVQTIEAITFQPEASGDYTA